MKLLKIIIVGLLMTSTIEASSTVVPVNEPKALPDYVLWDEQTDNSSSAVRQVAVELRFPLSEQDRQDIKTLEEKYDSEPGCAGLAAPQIGLSKRFIIFAVSDDPELKKWRPDLTQSMPKTIWLNPSWEPVGLDTHVDYEACFTVPNMAGPVKRYTKINYKAYDLQGKLIEGTAEGFLARVIQHEVDHLQGKLYIDYVDKKDLMSMEEYREMRKKSIGETMDE